MTELVRARADRAEAQRITAAIDVLLRDVGVRYEALIEAIEQAIALQVWDALGYARPHDWFRDRMQVLSGMRLGTDLRRAMASMLRTGAQMSTRDVASVLGVSPATAWRDLEGADQPEYVRGGDGKARAARRTRVDPEPERPETISRHVRLPADLWEWAQSRATEWGITVSQVVAAALDDARTHASG